MSQITELHHQSRDYARVEQAISYLEENYRDQPELETVAEAVGLSAAHFQRMFKRWAGISPKRFVQYLTLDHARRRLADSASVLDATYDSGLSGPGRLHDLFVTYEAMTPGDYKRYGDGVEIAYGVHPSPFGPCFIGETERGVCALGFADNAASPTPLEDFKQRKEFRAVELDKSLSLLPTCLLPSNSKVGRVLGLHWRYLQCHWSGSYLRFCWWWFHRSPLLLDLCHDRCSSRRNGFTLRCLCRWRCICRRRPLCGGAVNLRLFFRSCRRGLWLHWS